MSKILTISDLHGKSTWKDIIAREEGNFDKVVFLGDYFDSFKPISAIEQIYNFKEIIDYKLNSGVETTLLWANHDVHYIRGWDEVYSGYQQLHYVDISEALDVAKDMLKVCHIDDFIMFSHAGVTKQWLKNNNIKESTNLDKVINKLFKKNFTPFKFNGYNPYGDNITQGPMWVRPYSLQKNSIDMVQVFGHTRQEKIRSLAINKLKNRLWCTDTLDTSKEYLLIDNGVFNIKQL